MFSLLLDTGRAAVNAARARTAPPIRVVRFDVGWINPLALADMLHQLQTTPVDSVQPNMSNGGVLSVLRVGYRGGLDQLTVMQTGPTRVVLRASVPPEVPQYTFNVLVLYGMVESTLVPFTLHWSRVGNVKFSVSASGVGLTHHTLLQFDVADLDATLDLDDLQRLTPAFQHIDAAVSLPRGVDTTRDHFFIEPRSTDEHSDPQVAVVSEGQIFGAPAIDASNPRGLFHTPPTAYYRLPDDGIVPLGFVQVTDVFGNSVTNPLGHVLMRRVT